MGYREEIKEIRKERTKRKNEVLEKAKRECTESLHSKLDVEVANHLARKVAWLEEDVEKLNGKIKELEGKLKAATKQTNG